MNHYVLQLKTLSVSAVPWPNATSHLLFSIEGTGAAMHQAFSHRGKRLSTVHMQSHNLQTHKHMYHLPPTLSINCLVRVSVWGGGNTQVPKVIAPGVIQA